MARAAVAVWQMAPTVGNRRANLARLAGAAGTARARGATILVTPELSLTGYDIGALTDDDTDPELLTDLSRIAHNTGLALVVGLALRQDHQTWNCSAVVDRTGDVRGVYRKMHLFGDLDRSRFCAGTDGPLVVDVDGITVGTLICYDIEFPEPARLAALAGAQLLAIPTANMTPWHFINEHVIPVRAFENQFYVAYANHHGTEGGTTYVGSSTIAAPDGATVRAGEDDEALILMALDTDDLAQRRREATYLTDRRPELYDRLCQEN
ncbi:MAG TPA: nitrilase-related carbon-nitrogen hydrolase [Tetrasphaera sp.]|uniref:nitrilase-related carbon-nitrogen hydrolase n=1 Tax=Nostocoides sp. TaxID=1917966 RepID=UPI002D086FDE|nr:nitrilase-related carbon-nitrogen hydrolase [Tetrasphaera sp.]HNQ06361.1 nitrilase-related carbon-nitrogen hydrolase [Tetrasphaera sp.]